MRSRLRAGAADDSGASLIFALILITVIALVSVAVLTLGDASVRSTVSMRDRSSSDYAADAAGEVALNQLRRDQFNGATGGCDTSATEVLSNLYPATGTAPGASAAVTCSADVNTGTAGGANSSPGPALLTMATGSEVGIQLNSSNNFTLKVKGGIFSNSTINLVGNKSELENTATGSYAYALNGCTGSSPLTVNASSVKDCNYSTNALSASDGRGKDPGTIAGHPASFDAPPGPASAPTIPACTGVKVYELSPGLYTDATKLNALTAGGTCGGSVVHLNPGRYFFNFAAGAPTWTMAATFLVGGTVSPGSAPLKVSPAPSMSGTCVQPGSAAATTSSGVELVFGGTSRMYLDGNGSPAASNGNIELCASNAPSGPPVVIYGLKATVGSVPALSGCITNPGYSDTGDSTHCALLGSNNSPNPLITLWGTTYAPTAAIELSLNNNTNQVFRWGLLVRLVRVRSSGSPNLSSAVIDVPSDAPAPFALPGQRYLRIYVCPGSSTCSTSGTLRLRASVILSAAAPRTVTVTSWATVR